LSFTLLRGGMVVLCPPRKAEATAGADSGVGGYLCLTLGTEEVKELPADRALGYVVRHGRLANRAQVLPASGTGAEISR